MPRPIYLIKNNQTHPALSLLDGFDFDLLKHSRNDLDEQRMQGAGGHAALN